MQLVADILDGTYRNYSILDSGTTSPTSQKTLDMV